MHITDKITRANDRDTIGRQSAVETRAGSVSAQSAALTSFEAPFRQGELLCGKYQLDQLIGVGGTAFVVSALHTELNDKVALKFLRPEFLANEAAVQRFADEARLAVKIKSDFVARVFDVGRLADGAPFIAMELLAGKNLSQVLLERERLACALAVTYVLQVCEALATAHALGIIHRDIKPSNLFLTEQNQGPDVIKVLDFGISKAGLDADTFGRLPRLTRTLIAFGSPPYMSPEQMRAKLDMDSRTDIWSLGCVLYELLSGKMPFDAASDMQVCSLVLERQPAPLSSLVPGVSPEFDAIVMRCLEKDPNLRFRNVAELATALAPFAPAPARVSAERCRHVLENLSPTPALPAAPSALGAQQIAQPRVAASQSPAATGKLPANLSKSRWPFAQIEPELAPAPHSEPQTTTSEVPAAPSDTHRREKPMAAEFAPRDDATPATRATQSRYARLWPLLAAVLIALITLVVTLRVRESPRPTLSSTPSAQPAFGDRPSLRGAPASSPTPSVASQAQLGVQVDPAVAQPTETPNALAPVQGAAVAPNMPALDGTPVGDAHTQPSPLRRTTAARALRPTKPTVSAQDKGAIPDPAATGDVLTTRDSTPAQAQPQAQATTQLELSADDPLTAPISAVNSYNVAPAAARAPTARPAITANAAPSAAAPTAGIIAPRALASTIRNHAAEIQECVERAQMEHPDLHGRMLFRATVDRLGNVTRAWSDGQLDNSTRLTTCILTRARQWKFPQPAGGVSGSVSYTFVFD